MSRPQPAECGLTIAARIDSPITVRPVGLRTMISRRMDGLLYGEFSMTYFETMFVPVTS